MNNGSLPKRKGAVLIWSNEKIPFIGQPLRYNESINQRSGGIFHAKQTGTNLASVERLADDAACRCVRYGTNRGIRTDCGTVWRDAAVFYRPRIAAAAAFLPTSSHDGCHSSAGRSARALWRAMKKAGANAPAFSVNILFRPQRSAPWRLPYPRPTNRRRRSLLER